MTALGFWLLLAAPAGAAPAETPARDETPLRFESFGEYGERIHAVVEGYTVRSTLGPADVPLPSALSDFLLDHLEFSADVARRRGIAPYRIETRGPRRSWADDGDGTAGLVDLVERRETERVYYGEGIHRAPLLPPIHAAAVMVLTLRPEQAPGGCAVTRSYLHVYVRLRNPFLSGLMKAFRPLLRGTIIGKLQKALVAADGVGRLVARDPAVLADEARRSAPLPAADLALLQDLIARFSAAPRSCAAER